MATFTTDLLKGQQYLFDGDFAGSGASANNFYGSGATVVVTSGADITIYSPTGSSGGLGTASNGLTALGGDVKLGGMLTNPTNIELSGNTFIITETNSGGTNQILELSPSSNTVRLTNTCGAGLAVIGTLGSTDDVLLNTSLGAGFCASNSIGLFNADTVCMYTLSGASISADGRFDCVDLVTNNGACINIGGVDDCISLYTQNGAYMSIGSGINDCFSVTSGGAMLDVNGATDCIGIFTALGGGVEFNNNCAYISNNSAIVRLTGSTIGLTGGVDILTVPNSGTTSDLLLVRDSLGRVKTLSTSQVGGGSITGGTNGLSVSGADIALGGTLTGNTAINLNTNALNFNSPYISTGAGFAGSPMSSWLQQDGKIISGGQFLTYNGVNRSNIARVNTDGSVDTSFTTGIGFGGFGGVDKMALHSGGTIIVVGSQITTYDGHNSPKMVRINSNGTYDSSFVVTGTGLDGYNAPPGIFSILIQSDNKILVGGSFDAYNGTPYTPNIPANLIRFNWDGSIDTTFSGITTGFTNGWVNSLAQQPDGKILVGGYFDAYNGNFAGGIIRLNVDGSVDPTFSGATLGGFFPSQSVEAIKLQPDGKILVGGSFSTYVGVPCSNGIIRLEADGSVDTGFTAGAGVTGIIITLTLQPDGKILIGGSFNQYNGNLSPNIVRINSDGTYDNTLSVGTGLSSIPLSILVQGDGKIIATGYFTTYKTINTVGRILRISSGGTYDSTFNAATLYYNIRLNNDAITSSKFVLSGTSTNRCNTAFGHKALCLNTTGCRNIAIGCGAGQNETGSNKLYIQNDTSTCPLIGGCFLPRCVNICGGFKIGGAASILVTPAVGNCSTDCLLVWNTGDKCIKQLPFSIFPTPTPPGICQACNGLSTNGTTVCLGGNLNMNTNIELANNKLNLSNTNTLFSYGPGFNSFGLTVEGSPIDGKILVGGNFSEYDNILTCKIAKLCNNGCLDYSFAPTALGCGFDSKVNKILYDTFCANGSMLVGGNFNNYNGRSAGKVAKLDVNGNIDDNFTMNFYPGLNNEVNSIAQGSNGSFIAVGSFTTNPVNTVGYITKINCNGSVDPVFDTNAGGGFDLDTYSVAIDSNQKILVGGQFTCYCNSYATRGIVRLDYWGTVDPTFSGASSCRFGLYESVNAIVENTDNTIVLGGYFNAYNFNSSPMIVRLLPDGNYDPTFVVGTGFDATVRSIALQPDNKLILGGSFTTYSGVTANRMIRLNPNGTIDNTFNIGTGFDNNVMGIKLLPDGKIDVTGEFMNINGNFASRFVRLNSNGTIYGGTVIDNFKFSGDTLSLTNLKTSGLTLQDGNQQAGYVLTSNAQGVGTWQASSGGVGSASNGLRVSGDNIVLGGTLTGNTNIGGAYTLALTGASKLSTWCGYQISGFTVMCIPGALTSGNFKAGQSALNSISTGACNTGVGAYALNLASTGHFNTAVGGCALRCSTTGCNNTAVGWSSMCKNTGKDNVSMGASSLRLSTTASCNTVIGVEGILSNTIGSGNTAMGYKVLSNNVTGNNNVAIGRCAGFSETGSNKLYIANCASCSLIYGEFDTKMVKIDGCMCVTNLPVKTTETCGIYINGSGRLSVGLISGGTSATTYTFIQSGATKISQVGNNVTIYTPTGSTSGGGVTGATNLGSGNGSLFTNVSSSKINLKTLSGGTNITLTCNGNYVAINSTGDGSGIGWSNLTNGSIVAGCGTVASGATICRNTYYGVSAATHTTSGTGNTAIGFNTLHKITTACDNIAIGTSTLCAQVNGEGNIGIGLNTLCSNVSGFMNVAIGHCASTKNTCSSNVAIGREAFSKNVLGQTNVAIGQYAMQNSTGGDSNVAIGDCALQSVRAGQCNVAIGYHTLQKMTGGTGNIAIGTQVMCNNMTGNHNIGLGCDTMTNLISGNNNISIGQRNNALTSSGDNNIAIGCEANFFNSTGSENIAFGRCAGYSNIGSNSVFIGAFAGFSNTGTNSVYIGTCAGYNETYGSRLHIGNCDICSLIYGEFGNKRLVISGTTEVVSPASGGVCNEFYLGNKNTNGSWRIVVSGSSLVAQTRVATVWGGNKVLAP